MGRVKCDVSDTLTSLDSVVGASTERVYARSELTPPCYCSAAAKNRSACTELLCLALGFQPNGCMPDLSRNSPATVLLLQILVLPTLNCCLALGFQPIGLVPDLSLNCPATVLLLLRNLVLPALNCCLALRFHPNGCMPDLS